jgi:integrase
MRTISPGIRLKENGRYVATASFNGKRYYKEFDKERDALKWKKNFHPLAHSPGKKINPLAVPDQSNGKDRLISFGEVFEKYRKGFLESLDPYTRYKKTKRMERFLPNLWVIPMCGFTPEIINNHLSEMKLTIETSSRRCNFDKELKDLASIFNWYKDTIDFTYSNPVTKTHFKLGKVRDVEPKKKHMIEDELSSFFVHLEDPFQTLAIVQYLMAGRIQEAAAINDRTVNFKTGEIEVSEKLVWLKGNPQHRFGTKTGKESAPVKMPQEVIARLLRLRATRPKSCKYFFHSRGKPLRYNLILKKYNEALEAAGLGEFSGTHILRHSMAKITRKEGGLEACQAILRHTSARMSEHYAKLDANDEVNKVIDFASRIVKKLATSCDRVPVSS